MAQALAEITRDAHDVRGANLAETARNEHEIMHGAKIAENAEEVWGWTGPTAPFRLKRRTEFLIRRGGLTPAAHALEVGCGTGVVTSYLQLSGARITAIDLSPDLLAQALRKQWPSEVYFQEANAESLDFASESFDSVVGSSVLHHFDIDRSLSEMHRVLVPGGRIAFSEPNMLNPHIFLQKNIPYLKRLAGDSPDETAFVRWAFKRTLERVGFQDVEITPYDFLHPQVPVSMINAVSSLSLMLERTPVVREIAGSLIISARKAAS